MTIDSYSVEVLQLYHPPILDMKQLFRFVLYSKSPLMQMEVLLYLHNYNNVVFRLSIL